MFEPTNQDRADRGHDVVERYARDTRESGEPLEVILTDLLADVLHYVEAVQSGPDVDVEQGPADPVALLEWAAGMATFHYVEERAGR